MRPFEVLQTGAWDNVAESIEMFSGSLMRLSDVKALQGGATLREFLVNGFVMDDQRLKDPKGWDYFDELLARIRFVRELSQPSERCRIIPSRVKLGIRLELGLC